MKKTIILLLTTMMLLVSTPVFAEDTGLSEETTSGTTDITYTLAETYTVTIPASFSLDGSETSNSPATATVAITSKNLAPGHCVAVKMSSANDFNLKNGDKSIPYRIMTGVEEACSQSKNNNKFICTAYNDNEAGPGKTYKYLSGTYAMCENSASTTMEIYFVANDTPFANATAAGDYKDTLTFTCSIEALEENTN